MGLKAALAALFLLAVSPAIAHPSTCWMSGDDSCRQYVGKRLWVAIPAGNPNVVEVTLTRGDWTTSRTLKLKSGASFVVQGLDKASVGSPDFRVRLDDGRIGWIGTSSPFLIAYDPVARAKNAAAECARRGPPKIGMPSAELVETCWRRPARIIKRTTAAGVQEVYVYGPVRRVTVIDGKVSEIIESR